MVVSNTQKNAVIGRRAPNMYRCKKEVTGSNGVKKICRWIGVIDEYITHMKYHHPSSYFKLQNGQIKFEWSTPFIGDQIDICMLEHESSHYLYKIFYSAGEMRHTFLNFEETVCRIKVRDENVKKVHECCLEGDTVDKLIKYKAKDRRVIWTLMLDRILIE